MSAGIVLDASVVVEGLAGEGRAAVWARGMMATPGPLAPELLYVEVAQSLKRHETLGKGLEQAFQDLVRLPVTHISFLDVASVVWELRHNFSLYDALYVAIALTHQAPLATLDRKMASSAAGYCTVPVGPPHIRA